MFSFEKRQLSEGEVQDFIKESVFEIKNSQNVLSSCIDGRYSEDEARLAPRSIPGSDPGILLLFLATLRKIQNLNLNLDLKEKVFNEIIENLGGPKNFKMHTDDHSVDQGIIAGCGHMKLAKQSPLNYGAAAEDLDFIFSYLEKLKKEGIKEMVLEGNHNEFAIFVINNKNIGMLHKKGDKQAFVFHQGLANDLFENIAKKILNLEEIKSTGILKEEFNQILKETFNQQLKQTVLALAPNIPIYEVDFKDNKVIINQAAPF
ncbi:MAG: hypothetical protein ACPL3E_01205 [Minisyncoccia bacterium]